MKRRFLQFLLYTALALFCFGTLTACGDDEPDSHPSTIDGQHIHQFGDWQAVLEASCTTDGQLMRSCVCGKVEYSTAPAFGHTPVTDAPQSPTCTETGLTEGSHCKVCNDILIQQQVIPPMGHQEVIATPTKEATCTQPGATVSTYCTVCNEILSASTVIPPKGHKEVVLNPGQAPTCTAPGWSASSCCSVCKEVLSQSQPLPVTGHSPVIDTPAKAATCTEPGTSEASHCDICGQILSTVQALPATGHKEAFDPAVAADCIHNGLSDGIHCSICNTILRSQTVLPKLGHDMTQDQCRRCGATASKGLSFALSSDGTYFILTGMGSCTDTDLLIPSAYNGKPVAAIGEQAFFQCISIHSIDLPGSILSIGTKAFYGCSSLTGIMLPAGLTQIGTNPFGGCTSLASISVDSGNSVYHSHGNCLIETGTKTLIAGCKTSQIPTDGTVTIIADYAFDGCQGLTSITLPDSITSIGAFAFSKCRNLTSIHFLGSKLQWQQLDKKEGWNYLTRDLVIHCTDGDLMK